MSLTSTIGISPPEQQNKEHRPADERHYRADGQDYRRRDQLCERVGKYQQQRTADRGAGDKEAVVVADKKAHDMRRDEADKADYADERHRDRRRQRAHRHAGDHDLFRVHAEALGRVVARFHGVIVPAVIHVVDEAEVSETPSNINVSKNMVLFAFAGAIISVIYVLVGNMLDTTVKSSEEIEKNYGIPVLASIPLIESFEGEKGGRK